MTERVTRNKQWGYEVEVQALRALQSVWADMERTGASNQKEKGWPDLINRADRDYVLLVVTKEKGRKGRMLVSLSMEDFLQIAACGIPTAVAVSVKGRQQLWLHSMYEELFGAMNKWRVPAPPKKPVGKFRAPIRAKNRSEETR